MKHLYCLRDEESGRIENLIEQEMEKRIDLIQ